MYQVCFQSGWSKFFDTLFEAEQWASKHAKGFYTIFRVGAP